MGWYAAVGRPLFFALPPETAHRVAGAALGLPLPWSRIGHAADEPSLATEFCGLPLATPIGLAAGFDKTCAHLGALGSLGFGYVVGGTITRAARAGNPKPRIARSPDHALDGERDGPAQPRRRGGRPASGARPRLGSTVREHRRRSP